MTRDKRELELYLERINHVGLYNGRDYTCTCSKPRTIATVAPRSSVTTSIAPRTTIQSSNITSSQPSTRVVMTKSPATILPSGNRVDGQTAIRSNIGIISPTVTPNVIGTEPPIRLPDNVASQIREVQNANYATPRTVSNPTTTPRSNTTTPKVITSVNNITLSDSVKELITNSDQVDGVLIPPTVESPLDKITDLPSAPQMEFKEISEEELEVINDIVDEQKSFAANNPDGRKYFQGDGGTEQIPESTTKAGNWIFGLLLVSGLIMALKKKKKNKSTIVDKPAKVTL